MINILRRIPRSRLAFLGILGSSKNPADVVKTPGYEDLDKKYHGMEALRRMFRPDEYGELSPELITALHMSASSVLISMIYGAFRDGRRAWSTFLENNAASQFVNHIDAKKKLQDQVTMAMCKGALKWSMRLGLFSSIFIILTTTIRVYRGEAGLIEYIGAATITGGLFRFSLGPKGMVAGALAGAVIGTLAGVTSWGILKLSGYTMHDIEQVQKEYRLKRNEGIREAMRLQYATEEEAILVQEARRKEKEEKTLPLDSVKDV